MTKGRTGTETRVIREKSTGEDASALLWPSRRPLAFNKLDEIFLTKGKVMRTYQKWRKRLVFLEDVGGKCQE